MLQEWTTNEPDMHTEDYDHFSPITLSHALRFDETTDDFTQIINKPGRCARFWQKSSSD